MEMIAKKMKQQEVKQMAKNINVSTIYIRDKDLEKWKEIVNKSDFVSWCINRKLPEYKKKQSLGEK
ncbi:MAG: hypothetical protein UR73_C0038G0015 [candidate division WS6 bacterium GW2011_GWF1_35_23]|uniref:Uncharacterized protein n=1 Tax=candidate division WS6 bacterium GW2011_GWF1_35_23 TaxID=1619097 RepID=A0A0G0F529_9BACT|nr:MAG: hypothetical protein UR73_C0038G0015 [candidate division WS6 bacterium GW2011_GWF1_35_23]KKQ29799.1 MAG: hypothetical protein US46_C0017G0015 [Candidatus Shapirobacteria bacterium GW2011_GWF2_37_20]